MKSYLRIFLFFYFITFSAVAQLEIESIKLPLNQYIEGTAIGDRGKLKNAFHPDFNLFLVSADTLRIINGFEYINRVELDKVYNRKAKILSIDCENDTIIGKIEVYFPDRNQVATDYLLLLKRKDGWKIIHKIIDLKGTDLAQKNPKNEYNNIIGLNKTLLNYIEGTANGEIVRINKAFHKDFNLYYIKDSSITVLPGTRYLQNFTEGKKNNRIGKIVGVDFEDTAAYAKVEVKMPGRERRVMDFLLLRKVKGDKSFTTNNYQ